MSLIPKSVSGSSWMKQEMDQWLGASSAIMRVLLQFVGVKEELKLKAKFF